VDEKTFHLAILSEIKMVINGLTILPGYSNAFDRVVQKDQGELPFGNSFYKLTDLCGINIL
jgi:hypothetical protein